MNAREHLSVRNVSPELAEALEAERVRRGTSLNQTVLDLLRQGLGVREKRSNGLGKMGGTWSEKEYREFNARTAHFSKIDEEMWK